VETDPKTKKAKPVDAWTNEQKEAARAAFQVFLTENTGDEDKPKTRLKLACEDNFINFSLKNYSKGAPVSDNGKELEQTEILRFDEDSADYVKVNVKTFLEDMTATGAVRPVKMKLVLSHKHVFSSSSMTRISDKWVADFIRYDPPGEIEPMAAPELDEEERAMKEAAKKRKLQHNTTTAAAAAAKDADAQPAAAVVAAALPSSQVKVETAASAAIAVAPAPADARKGDADKEEDEAEGEGAEAEDEDDEDAASE